jgi:hypothetical protein
MKVHLTVKIEPVDEDFERFAVDNCKPIQVDLHMSREEIYAILVGHLSPMSDKTASQFVGHKDLK